MVEKDRLRRTGNPQAETIVDTVRRTEVEVEDDRTDLNWTKLDRDRLNRNQL